MKLISTGGLIFFGVRMMGLIPPTVNFHKLCTVINHMIQFTTSFFSRTRACLQFLFQDECSLAGSEPAPEVILDSWAISKRKHKQIHFEKSSVASNLFHVRLSCLSGASGKVHVSVFGFRTSGQTVLPTKRFKVPPQSYQDQPFMSTVSLTVSPSPRQSKISRYSYCVAAL